jgi:excisionase family DNA binding protein
MELENMPDLLTADQAGGYLGVSRSTIYSWCRTNKMPGIKLNGTWRLRKDSFIAWIAEQERASCSSTV